MKIETFVDRWMGENSYVAYFEDTLEAFVIDPSLSFKEMKSFIVNNKLNVKYIILTHAHSDHITDVGEMKALTGAPVVVHQDEKDILEDPNKNLSSQFPGGPKSFKADICVSDKDKLKISGHTISFIHTPGHTKGGMCVRVGMDMFTGDTIFAGEVGRTDLYSGDYNQLLKSLKRLSKMENELRLYPGHGPASTIAMEKQINRYMKLVL